MTSRSRARRLAGIVGAVLAASAAVVLTGGPVSATPTNCFGMTHMLGIQPSGVLQEYYNTDPDTGGADWLGPLQVGTGWSGRLLYGNLTDLYNITPSGERRWDEYGGGGNWYSQFGTSSTGLTIGTGWGAYLSGPQRNLITVGVTGIFVVRPNGDLVRYQYNAGGGWTNPAGTVVATGWQNYTAIAVSMDTASRDVLYAVDGAGNLFRYRYDLATASWPRTPDLLGSGWGGLTQMFSPGKDILYTVDGARSGRMTWYHYNGDTRTWDNNGVGRVVGTGWYSSAFTDVALSANTCPNTLPSGYVSNPYVICQANARVFDARSDGSLWLYEDTSPDKGAADWVNVRQIGTGWTGRTLAADAGFLYNITPAGDLRLYHYGQTTWADLGHTIGTGWGAWESGQSLITTDSAGTLYVVNAQGQLVSYRYDEATGQWTDLGTVLDNGWGGYRLIAAGDSGEFYGIDAQGNLLRSHYDAATGQWISHNQLVGSGWQDITSLSSAGSNTFYAFNGSSGQASWYDLGAPVGTVPSTFIGSGWFAPTHVSVSTTTDTCAEPALYTPPA